MVVEKVHRKMAYNKKKQIFTNASLFHSFCSISVLIGVAVDIEYHRKPAGIYLM